MKPIAQTIGLELLLWTAILLILTGITYFY